MSKTLNVKDGADAKEKVKDIEVYGDPDKWQLVSKASSKKEAWMKSTKAMNLPYGSLVQVSTQQGDNVAESVTYVPDVRFEDGEFNSYGKPVAANNPEKTKIKKYVIPFKELTETRDVAKCIDNDVEDVLEVVPFNTGPNQELALVTCRVKE